MTPTDRDKLAREVCAENIKRLLSIVSGVQSITKNIDLEKATK